MRSPAPPTRSVWGLVGAVWGLAGVAALLGYAIGRLAPLAFRALDTRLSVLQAIVLVLWVAFMLGAEGYRGFQRAFSPRVAARCRYLSCHPTPWRVVSAPLFAMAFYAAPLRRRVAAFALTGGVVLLVIVVRRLDQPWRGIVDAGVVLGLLYGCITLIVFWVRAVVLGTPDASPEVVQERSRRDPGAGQTPGSRSRGATRTA